jgi:hypothetical protein
MTKAQPLPPSVSRSSGTNGYIQSILEDFNMADCNPAAIPIEGNLRLSKTMCADFPERKVCMAGVPYHKLVGNLLYLTVATRPDISYVVSVLCRFVDNPDPLHRGATKRPVVPQGLLWSQAGPFALIFA